MAFPLPTRHADAARLRARCEAIGQKLAPLLHAEYRAGPRQPERRFGEELAAALQLFKSGALDEAALAYDRLIGPAAEVVHQLDRPAELVDASVVRATIAGARGERATAIALLGRLLRYDPTFSLEVGERTPTLKTLLAEAHERNRRLDSIETSDLGRACDQAEILLVARRSATGLEVSRFDQCTLVARASAAWSAPDEDIARALVERALAASARTDGARRRWAPWLVAGAGLAATVTGGVFVGLTHREYVRLRDTCGVTGQCDPDRYGHLETEQYVGWILGGLGTAVTAAGIWWGIRSRSGARATQPSSPPAGMLSVEF